MKTADALGSAVVTMETEDAAPDAGAAWRLSIDDLLPESRAPEQAPRTPEQAPRAAAGSGPSVAAAPGVRTAAGGGPSVAAAPGVRAARVLDMAGRSATIALRGATAPLQAELAPEVDAEVIADALAQGDLVLVECCDGEAPVVVAALTTRKPREIRLRAATIHIEGEQEVLLRSGHGAVRVRQDGDIEVVGSRISAASRGLFRLVGRILRLN